MLKRIITSIISLCVFAPILWFSNTYVFVAAAAVACFISCWEMMRCVGYDGRFEIALPVYVTPAALVLLSRGVLPPGRFIQVAILMIFVFMFYLFAVCVFSRGRYDVRDVSMVFMTVVYIDAAFISLVLLRDIPNVGGYLCLLVFIGAWVTDIFAYFTGKLLGRHKLIPEISPNKTVEGTVGGSVFCVIAFLAYGFIIEKYYSAAPNYAALAVIGAVISVVAQLGDLTASAIKRHYQIKDFGKLFPGHGGILDRFDSVLPVSIILLMFCSMKELFVKLF